MTDRSLITTTAFLRALATGMSGVLLGIYLGRLGLDRSSIGIVVAAGLAGGAVATLAVTVTGGWAGRRASLVALASLGMVGSVLVAVLSEPLLLGVFAFVGMLNGMGRDRGPCVVLEQALLPATTTDAGRTRAFAWYNVWQDAGIALGGLAAALPQVLRDATGVGEETSFRLVIGGQALLMLATAILYLGLSPGVEVRPEERAARMSSETRRLVRRISCLFALDSLGGGFLTTALVSLFLHERFGASAAAIGALFFWSRVANAASYVAAARLARRIGLVNTMVFTHMPASLLLVGVAYAPSFPVAVMLLLAREALVEMDVPTRQSYVMAVVRPEERAAVSGVTHLVRLCGWALGPSMAGFLMEGVSLSTPLLVGAVMKIAYDGMLYLSFRGVRPPEEADPRSV